MGTKTTGTKRRVGVLGATGAVGQRFIQHLEDHPWFEVVSLMASPRSVGRPYSEAADWILPEAVPSSFASLEITAPEPDPSLDLVFSAVSASVAAQVEERWAQAGVAVFSNARTHRMDADVPLVIPEVNPGHLAMIPTQRVRRGFPGLGCIVTNANCSSTFLTMALAPLHEAFGVNRVMVTTLQAMSGAGLGLSALRTHGNVIPFIEGEEAKLETEPLKMLGTYDGTAVVPAAMRISAQVNRVPVVDGHTEAVSVTLDRDVTAKDVAEALAAFTGVPQAIKLPSAPQNPVVVLTETDRPQPALDLRLEDGMATVVGNVRPCPVMGWKFTLLGHNTIRGAAAGSLLNAELACAQGWT